MVESQPFDLLYERNDPLFILGVFLLGDSVFVHGEGLVSILDPGMELLDSDFDEPLHLVADVAEVGEEDSVGHTV